MISVHFQGKPFNITVIQVYAPINDTEEAEVDQFYEDLQHLLELTPKKKKRCSFHQRGLECKRRKSRDTWGNRHIWSWSTKWSRAKVNRVLSREHTNHRKLPSSGHTRDDSTLGHYRMVSINIRLLISFVVKNGVAPYSEEKQDLELTVAQIMSSLLQHSGLNWRKLARALGHSGMV